MLYIIINTGQKFAEQNFHHHDHVATEWQKFSPGKNFWLYGISVVSMRERERERERERGGGEGRDREIK